MRESGPNVDESEIYGRRDDVEKIVDFLLSHSTNVSVIPIVGIGETGKTTLAQLVYNDKRLDGFFDLKIWVSLYDNFNTKKLSLCGKKYLLVLDDVWNDDDQEEWDKVRNLLRCGADGSKIIVTTRSEKVVSLMSSSPPYVIGGLTKEDCWTLFKQRAFGHGEENAFPNLLPIGQQIINRCKGVPLAVKVFGGLLWSIREEHEWLRVRNSDLWNLDAGENKILSVMRLSFNHMPSHLKRCFAYCAIFLRNYHVNKEKLIQKWIAGGLVQLSAEDDPNMLEHIGNRFMEDLQLHSLELLWGVHDENKRSYYTSIQTSGTKEEFEILMGGFCLNCTIRSYLLSQNPLIASYFGETHNFEVIGRLQHAMAFERLTIMYCSNMTSLPNGLQHLQALKSPTILSCSELESLPEGLQHLKTLQNLEIHLCPKLMELPKLENPHFTKIFGNFRLSKHKVSPLRHEAASALQHLSIRGCPDLEKKYKKKEGEN
ncbi:hypothetical protein REPUB_Repub02eG0070000 [Reevesia pubescens]